MATTYEVKSGSKARVVVVVRDASLARRINACLSDSSFDVLRFGMNPDAEQNISASAPDLMIVEDATLDGNGHRLFQSASLLSDAPIIVVGNKNGVDVSVKALYSGADLYLAKESLNRDHLVARVLALMRRSQGQG